MTWQETATQIAQEARDALEAGQTYENSGVRIECLRTPGTHTYIVSSKKQRYKTSCRSRAVDDLVMMVYYIRGLHADRG